MVPLTRSDGFRGGVRVTRRRLGPGPGRRAPSRRREPEAQAPSHHDPQTGGARMSRRLNRRADSNLLSGTRPLAERVPAHFPAEQMRALRLYLIAGFTCLTLGVPDVPTLQDVMRVKLDSKLCVRTLNRTGQVRACSAPPRIPTVRYRRSPPRERIYPARSGLHLPLRVRVPHRSVAT